MPTCKDVTRAIAQDAVDGARWRRRLAFRLHLLMCRHCRRYAAQMRSIGTGVRQLIRTHTEDPETLARLKTTIMRESDVPDASSDVKR